MVVALKELGDILTGNTPSKDVNEYYDYKDICFVKPDIISDTEISIISDSNEYISEKARTKARIVSKDTLFVTCIGTIGKIGIASDGEFAFNQQINAIIPNKRVIPKYLAYNLLYSKPKLTAISNAPVVPIINKSQFSEFEINIETDLRMQERIISTLDLIQSTIAKCNTQLSKLDLLVKSQFVEMFGEPISNPMGWEVKTLKEISALITNGNTPKGGSENYIDNGIIFLRSQNVWRNRIDLDDVVYIDEETHEKMRKSSVHHNDILITKTGRINTENSSLGRAALYQGADNSANINGHVYLVRLKNNVSPKFVVTILTGEAYRKYIRKVCVGGIDKRQINLDQVEDFPIILPPLEQQNEFAIFAEQIDKSKLAVKKTLEKAETLKKALMQEYFG